MRNSRLGTPEPAGKPNKFLIIIAAAAAIVYFAGSAAARSFISEKIIEPVIDFFSKEEAKESFEIPMQPQIPSRIAEYPEGDAEEVFAKRGKTVLIPEGEIYLLLCGSYSEKSFAENAAVTAKRKGGAGYIYENKDEFAVVLAAYKNEADAKNVMEKLPDMELEILPLVSKSLSFEISAEEDIAGELSNISNRLSALPESFYDIAILLDSGKKDMGETISELEEIKKELYSYKLKLDILSAANDNRVVSSLKSCLDAVYGEVKRLLESEDKLALSSRLKYAYVFSFEKKKAALEAI